MSIERQKKFLFVPFANILICAFQWYKCLKSNQVTRKKFFKIFMRIVLLCFMIVVPEIIIEELLDNEVINSIVDFVATYCCMFGISIVLIKDQEVYNKT